MRELVVLKDKCPQDHPCPSVGICPVNALMQRKVEAPEVNNEVCIKCGRCVNFCPKGALKLMDK